MEKVLTRNFGLENSHRLETYLKNKGYQAARKALTQMTGPQVIDEIKKSNLRGLGGAGFPTGMKSGRARSRTNTFLKKIPTPCLKGSSSPAMPSQATRPMCMSAANTSDPYRPCKPRSMRQIHRGIWARGSWERRLILMWSCIRGPGHTFAGRKQRFWNRWKAKKDFRALSRRF